MAWLKDDTAAVGRVASTQTVTFGRWVTDKVVTKAWKWTGDAVKIAFLVTASVVYVLSLVLPEACSVVMTTLAYGAYKLSYQILFLAARLYLASVRLAVAARRVRDFEPQGLFEY